MDENEARHRARMFLSKLPESKNSDIETYAEAIHARIRYEALDVGEAGFTIPKGAGFVITVNADESPERQRFTVCHEIGHVVLQLSSQHNEVPSWRFAKRHPNEVWCDVFASELLMPYVAFQKAMPKGDPSVEAIYALAQTFQASFPATASRYASAASFPCAYVTMDGGEVRYAGLNTALRRTGLRIPLKTVVPPDSVARRLRELHEELPSVQEIAQDVWFENPEPGATVCEMSRHYRKYDQTISLLWCSEEDLPKGEVDRLNQRVAEEPGLEELTGVLEWRKRSRRP